MIELEDISFRKYAELKDKSVYNYAAMYSRVLNTSKDIFDIGEFNKLTFGQVKDAQTAFANGVYWLKLLNFVSEIKSISVKKIAKYKFFELCKFRRYVEEQLDKIQRIESKMYYEVTGIDKAAGIDKLTQFGVVIQIDKLAGGDVMKWELVKQLPYAIGFMKLYMDKTVDEVNMEKNRIINKPKR
jgi:hypothetical protein